MCFAHSIFNFQFLCQHEAILFIPRIWSSVFWGGFLFCSSSSFSSCVLWGPISSGMRFGDKVRGEQCGSWVGLSPLYVFCSWRAAVEQGKGLSATPFLGAEGRKRELACCRGSHGKEMINWESFQETSSKWFEALWTTRLVVRLCGVMWTLCGFMCLQTHMKPPLLYQTSHWCWKRRCPGRKTVHDGWAPEGTYNQWCLDDSNVALVDFQSSGKHPPCTTACWKQKVLWMFPWTLQKLRKHQ